MGEPFTFAIRSKGFLIVNSRFFLLPQGSEVQILVTAFFRYFRTIKDLLSLAKPIDPEQRMGLRISERGGKARVWSETNNIQFNGEGFIYVLDPTNFRKGNHHYEVYSDGIVKIEQEITVNPEILRLMMDKGDIECDITL